MGRYIFSLKEKFAGVNDRGVSTETKVGIEQEM